MRVLLVGSGAREHAIAWKLRQSPRLDDLLIAPGNAGTARIGRNLPVRANDIDGLVRAASEHRVDLVVVGPEEPLALGVADRLAERDIPCFGPSRAAARIEASKAFAKGLMARHGIRTAAFRIFDEAEAAKSYVNTHSGPIVVKADGLAAGKGVVVADDTDEALRAVDAAMVDQVFGEAGSRVIIEERLSGREVSAHAFTDGATVVHMPFACDYKRVYDGDRGPNTGGMGVYSPPPWLDASLAADIQASVTEAVVRALAAEGRPYRGVIYPGLMVTADGPMVVEFNCRLGDPEAQALLPRLQSDLLEILWAVANNRLHEARAEWSDEACVGVVLASGGYPGEYATGLPISGLDDVDPDVMIFHAGTRLADDGRTVLTAGGRVLTVAATGPTLAAARAKVYANVERIRFEGMHYRRDIAAGQ